MKKKNYLFGLLVALIALVLSTGNVYASEVIGTLNVGGSETSGTLTTGISATLGQTINGIVIAPPNASPAPGSYSSAQSVALTAEGATSIRYTKDGSNPSCMNGNIYSGVISVGSTQSIKAISCYSNGASSTVASYAYVINIPATSSSPNTTNVSSGGGGGGGGGYIPTCNAIIVPSGGYQISVADNTPSQGMIRVNTSGGVDTTRMALSFDETFAGIGIQTYSKAIDLTLKDPSTGTKTLYVRFYNACGSLASVSVSFLHEANMSLLTSSGTIPSEGQVLGERWTDVTAEERVLTSTIDSKIVSRLSGRILLQVERFGQAWYLDPISLKRYYLQDGTSAYVALRTFGLGITNVDLAKIPVGTESRFEMTDTDSDGLPDKLEEALKTDPTNVDTNGDGVSDGVEVLKSQTNPIGSGKIIFSTTLISRLKGRILLQVQSRGEAWYVNPVDGKRYYLADGEAAYQIMRYLSLGITNDDIRKISVGEMAQ